MRPLKGTAAAPAGRLRRVRTPARLARVHFFLLRSLRDGALHLRPTLRPGSRRSMVRAAVASSERRNRNTVPFGVRRPATVAVASDPTTKRLLVSDRAVSPGASVSATPAGPGPGPTSPPGVPPPPGGDGGGSGRG